MRSVPLVVRGTLYTTSLEANVASVMIGLTIGQTIRSVMEIVKVLMVEIVGVNQVARDLVGILLRGGLLMRSSVCMRRVGILEAPGAKGEVAGVEAMQRGHPLPVLALQPREVHRRLGILALARHPLIGAQSMPHARDPYQVGRRCQTRRSWTTWVK